MSVFSSLAKSLAKTILSKVASSTGLSDLWAKLKAAKEEADATDDSTLVDAEQFAIALKNAGFGDDLISAVDAVCSLVGYDSTKIDVVMTALKSFVDVLIAQIDTSDTDSSES